MMTSAWRGTLAASASSLIGGACVAATRLTIDATDPMTLAVLRFGIGTLCPLPLALLVQRAFVAGRDLLATAALGVLFFTLFPVLFNAGLAHTTAARGALALTTMPVQTLLVAVLLGVENATRSKMLGAVLAFLGAGVALGGQLDTSAPAGAWKGDLLMIASASVGSLYSVLSHRLFTRNPPLALTAWMMLSGTLALAGATTALIGWAPPSFDATQWAAVLFLGVAGGMAAFYLWALGLRLATPSRVAVALTLNPIAAMALGTLALGEPLGAAPIVGLATVAAGIVLANRPDGTPDAGRRQRQDRLRDRPAE